MVPGNRVGGRDRPPISRREALRLGTLVAGAAWVTPVIKPIDMTAAAAETTSGLPTRDSDRSRDTGVSAEIQEMRQEGPLSRSGGQRAESQDSHSPHQVLNAQNRLALERDSAGDHRGGSVTTGSGVASANTGATGAGPRPRSGPARPKEVRLHLTG